MQVLIASGHVGSPYTLMPEAEGWLGTVFRYLSHEWLTYILTQVEGTTLTLLPGDYSRQATPWRKRTQSVCRAMLSI